MSNLGKKRITQEQRDQIASRGLAGEKTIALAEEFGVSTAYVSMLKIQAVDPMRYQKKTAPCLKKLTDAELAEIAHVLATTTPADHGMRSHPQPSRWLIEHGQPLAEKLFKKQPSRRVVSEFMAPHLSKKMPYEFTRPTPPLPHHIDQIPPELAKDPSYVAYYLSTICEQIAWRSYESALADYDARFGGGVPHPSAAESTTAPRAADPQDKRNGKHTKRKGSPFTPPKKRRR
jgi:hypothetical protein